MSEFKFMERIDAYLEGGMTEGEKLSFERALQEDDLLRAEYDACLAAQKAAELMAFKGMLERVKLETKTGTNETVPDPKKRRWLLPFCLIVVAGLLLWWKFLPNEKKNIESGTQTVPQDSAQIKEIPPVQRMDSIPDKKIGPSIPKKELKDDPSPEKQKQAIALAKSLYEPVKFASTRGVQSLPGNDSALLAALAFDSSDFRQAARLAANIKKSESGYWQARSIAAHAAFNLGEYRKAAEIYREITIASGEAGKWTEGYLVLSLLAGEESETAEFKALLKKIQEDKWHPFHEKSLKIDF